MRRTLPVALTLALALLAPAPTAQATYPGANGKLAFDEAVGNTVPSIAIVNPDGTGYQVLAAEGREPAWSPEGRRIAFESISHVVQRAAAVMDADGSDRRNVTHRRAAESDPTWSPDGEEIALPWSTSAAGGIAITRLDGTESRHLPTPSLCCIEDLEWAPTGDTIVFSAEIRGNTSTPAEIFRIESDGSRLTQLTNEETPATSPRWSPNGERILYATEEGHVSMRPDGTDRVVHTRILGADPVFSPDGAYIAYVALHQFSGGTRIMLKRPNEIGDQKYVSATQMRNLDWQRVDPVLPARPLHAPRIRAWLVPAYQPCAQPNRRHGPPLVADSCSPPVAASEHLTIGANGQPPSFQGQLSLRVLPGDTATRADEADVQLSASLSDVRCRTAAGSCSGGALSDYTGQLKLQFGLRITDKHNTFANPITVEDQALSAAVQCAATPASAAGSDCSLSTTLDTIIPGVVPEGKRSVWQLHQFVVYDGGANGDLSGELTPFAVPGVFVP